MKIESCLSYSEFMKVACPYELLLSKLLTSVLQHDWRSMAAHVCPSFREQTLNLLGYSLRRDHSIGHERGNQTVVG
jgi:hypothetical protein